MLCLSGARSGDFDCFQLPRANIFTCGHWTGHGLCWDATGMLRGIVGDLQETPNLDKQHLTATPERLHSSAKPASFTLNWKVGFKDAEQLVQVYSIDRGSGQEPNSRSNAITFSFSEPHPLRCWVLTLNTKGDLSGSLLFRQHLEFQNRLPVHTANFRRKKVKGMPLGCGLTQPNLGSSGSPHHSGCYTVQGSI